MNWETKLRSSVAQAVALVHHGKQIVTEGSGVLGSFVSKFLIEDQGVAPQLLRRLHNSLNAFAGEEGSKEIVLLKERIYRTKAAIYVSWLTELMDFIETGSPRYAAAVQQLIKAFEVLFPTDCETIIHPAVEANKILSEEQFLQAQARRRENLTNLRRLNNMPHVRSKSSLQMNRSVSETAIKVKTESVLNSRKKMMMRTNRLPPVGESTRSEMSVSIHKADSDEVEDNQVLQYRKVIREIESLVMSGTVLLDISLPGPKDKDKKPDALKDIARHVLLEMKADQRLTEDQYDSLCRQLGFYAPAVLEHGMTAFICPVDWLKLGTDIMFSWVRLKNSLPRAAFASYLNGTEKKKEIAWVLVFICPISAYNHCAELVNDFSTMMTDHLFIHDIFLANSKQLLEEAVESHLGRKFLTELDAEREEDESEEYFIDKSWGKGIFLDLISIVNLYKKEYLCLLELDSWFQPVFAWASTSLSIFVTVFAYGVFYSYATNNQIGVSETFLSTSICGLVFSAFGGQAMILLAPTIPLLAYTHALYRFAENMSLDFLILYRLTGIFAFVIMILYSLSGIVGYCRKVTRFTDELNAAFCGFGYLIYPIIWFISAYSSSVDGFEYAGVFMSLLLAAFSAYFLNVFSIFQQSFFGTKTVRRLFIVGKFLVLFVGTLLFRGSFSLEIVRNTPTVPMEGVGFPSTSSKSRTWTIPLDRSVENYSQTVGYAFMFGVILAFLVLFLHSITENLEHAANFRLKQISKYWDSVILAVLVFVSTSIGTPVVVGSVVLTLKHVLLLSVEKKEGVHLHRKKDVQKVIENRVTPLCTYWALLCFYATYPGWKYVPIGLLMGVFIRYGHTLLSFDGNQFIERIELFFVGDIEFNISKHKGQMIVEKSTIHQFTVLQGVLLAIMFVLWGFWYLFLFCFAFKKAFLVRDFTIFSSRMTSFLFPIVFLLSIELRDFLNHHWFSSKTLEILDSSDRY